MAGRKQLHFIGIFVKTLTDNLEIIDTGPKEGDPDYIDDEDQSIPFENKARIYPVYPHEEPTGPVIIYRQDGRTNREEKSILDDKKVHFQIIVAVDINNTNDYYRLIRIQENIEDVLCRAKIVNEAYGPEDSFEPALLKATRTQLFELNDTVVERADGTYKTVNRRSLAYRRALAKGEIDG